MPQYKMPLPLRCPEVISELHTCQIRPTLPQLQLGRNPPGLTTAPSNNIFSTIGYFQTNSAPTSTLTFCLCRRL
ncbi:unnamed protein product, partial [Clonostachys rosea f. rosea IK726]